jgi:dinuclear metal center YbgI/SA1388 family protein
LVELDCKAIIGIMEKLAPESLAEDWDNVGLQLGNLDKKVSKVLVALDMTNGVAQEAVSKGVDMVITHHPFIFNPVKSLREDCYTGRVAAVLIWHGIALYCAHTNLDNAPNGINQVLADMLGLLDIEKLQVISAGAYNKLVVFVPEGYQDKVLMAAAEAGAGCIGNYSHCTFQAPGTGTFLPSGSTNPFIGKPGQLERADEYRIETIVPAELTQEVVDAVLKVHPYEEVAYDIYRLQNKRDGDGPGRIGRLPVGQTLAEFAKEVKKTLGLDNIRLSGQPDRHVKKVALCGGSGGSLIEKAAQMGADVFVTGDIKYHDAQRALELGIALIDAGHYGTEKIAVDVIRRHIENGVMMLDGQVEVLASEACVDFFTIV